MTGRTSAVTDQMSLTAPDVPPSASALPPVRTLTLGLAQPHPLPADALPRAAATVHEVRSRLAGAGYEVQTVRLATRPVFDDLPDRSPAELCRYATGLDRAVADLGIDALSLGPVDVTAPGAGLEAIRTAADIVAGTDATSCAVLMATTRHGLRHAAALPTARAVLQLARHTPHGLGNFRFAMLACVPPGGPFFPAAYHRGDRPALALGFQSAGVVTDAVAGPAGTDLAAVPGLVRAALTAAVSPAVSCAADWADRAGVQFTGVDLSPAPAGPCSIVAAVERVTGGRFGAAGTLAAVGALTAGIRSVPVPACGFSGLMLPVLEDLTLARRWAEGTVGPDQLLAFSAVCGTGLDTVPLPGAVSEDELGRILSDVATLSVRWGKPLTARLLPVPGANVGDPARFPSPHLVEGVIR